MSITAMNIALANVSSIVETVIGGAVSEGGSLETSVRLVDGASFSLAYWRLSDGNGPLLSSLEHGHQRGAPAIDALGELRRATVGQKCESVFVDKASGDLVASFAEGLVLRAFRFRSLYEDWEVRTADGQYFWSNMIDFPRL